MLSVIIATYDSERALLTTLAALVPGAAAGTIREVLVSDAGSRDQTREVADIAGCGILVQPTSSLGARLKAAAVAARGPWLMFLRPGVVPDAAWIGEVTRFVQAAERSGETDRRVAVFRPGSADAFRPPIVEIAALLRGMLGGRPRPEQGLIISKAGYAAMGEHREDAADPEAELLRRIGRRRTVLLRCGAAEASID
jgi:glycosyltransferase involved in cell wall biosynthesis